MSLYETVGTKTYNELLAEPEAQVFTVPLTPGQGVLPMGTVLYRDSTGMFKAAATANVVTTNYLAVLGEDANTNVSETIAEDAKAYRAGTFVDGKVKLAAGAALTAAHKVVLRNQGIVFSPDTDAAEFNNVVE